MTRSFDLARVTSAHVGLLLVPLLCGCGGDDGDSGKQPENTGGTSSSGASGRSGRTGSGGSSAATGGDADLVDLTPSSQFEYYPLVLDAATGSAAEVECAEHAAGFSLNESALLERRYYRLCGDGEEIALGIFSAGYGTPLYLARFKWRDQQAGSHRDTTVVAYYADDDSNGIADKTRLVVDCYYKPQLGVVSPERVFDAKMGQLVCVPPEAIGFFPVHYYIESLDPLRLRVEVVNVTNEVIEMYALPGSAEIAKPAEPLCGLSTCYHLE